MIGYASFYLVRQNFSIAIPAICSDLQITKSDIGVVISFSAILYGIGKCVFGVIGDRYSARYVMTTGLLLAAFMNIFMGFSSVIPAFTIFWTLNFCFQSMGGPPCAKLLTYWYSPLEIGTKWSLWNTSHQIGSSIIVFAAPFMLMHFGWRYVFFIPGVVAIFLAIFLFNRLRDTPESLKLPSVEKMTGLASVAKSEKWKVEKEVKLTYVEILRVVLGNKFVWFIGLANLFVYVCRMTFLNWGPTLLLESKGSSLFVAGVQMVAFDVASMLGGLCAGYLSDKVFNGRRGPVSVLCMILCGFLVCALWFSSKNSHVTNSVCMLCIGFLISGPQTLIGVAAADLASKRAAATAAGFSGTLGYAGTAVAGFGTGYLIDNYGWSAVFITTIIAAGAAALFLALTWNKRSQVLADALKKDGNS
jgi:sugar phosphate permease